MISFRTSFLLILLAAVISFAGCSSTTSPPPAAPPAEIVSGVMSVDFGTVLVGNTKDTTITLTNAGTGRLVVKSEKISLPCFTSTRTGDTLAVGGGITLTLHDRPTDSLGNSGADTVVYGDSAKHFTILLTGKGYIPAPPPPTDYTYIFAGVDDGHVWRSADKGSSWNDMGAPEAGLAVTNLSAMGSMIFATTLNGVYRSSDNGANWARCTSGLGDSNVQTLCVFNGELFAGCVHNGVYRSSDSGASWQACGQTSQYIMSMVGAGKYIFASTTSNGLLRSSDNGKTWTLVGYGSIPSNSVAGLLWFNNQLYAEASGAGVYRSTDYGTHWTAATTGITTGALSQLATNGTVLVATGLGGVFRSTDTAKTWSNVYSFSTNYLPVGIAGFKQQFYFGIVGTGLVASADGAATWQPVNAPFSAQTAWCFLFK